MIKLFILDRWESLAYWIGYFHYILFFKPIGILRLIRLLVLYRYYHKEWLLQLDYEWTEDDLYIWEEETREYEYSQDEELE